MRRCAVSIDLDEVHHYLAIHGLEGGTASSLVYTVALPRIEAFARAHDIPLTLFIVGADVGRPGAAETLRAFADRGCELGNHTLDHPYRFAEMAPDQIREQVEGGCDAIALATGHRPTGFRAPGYTINEAVVAALLEAGVAYDSSVFPCPTYYGAKAAAMAFGRVAGRRSNAVLDRPRVLFAPRRPYRLGVPYWRSGHGMVELPIQTTPGARLPFIGTTLTLAGPTVAGWLASSVASERFVNLELHAMDFLETADGLQALAPYQPDVRIPVSRKLDALTAAVDRLRERGFGFVRLDEAAATVP
jgi:peptidoglycan-N-acetylglucosamine deacetylase